MFIKDSKDKNNFFFANLTYMRTTLIAMIESKILIEPNNSEKTAINYIKKKLKFVTLTMVFLKIISEQLI